MRERDTNLELFRIIVMFFIVLHHYVVNSGLMSPDGVILSSPLSLRSILLLLLGAWGKTGINCFLLITGYFMCKSNITLRKYVKLLGEVMFYKIIIYALFLISGYETFHIKQFLFAILLINQVNTNFTGCYLLFFLFIPFINHLINNIGQRQHIYLLALCGFTYVVFGTLHRITMNYVSWFIIIYLIAAYIRLYPNKFFSDFHVWAFATGLFIIVASLSIISGAYVYALLGKNLIFSFVTDCNSVLPLLVGISSFMLFKNMNIKYNRVINTVAASSFGVLCIHANSDTMRKWLWKDMLDNAGHYSPLHAILSSLCVYIVCTLIDMIRIRYIEKPFFASMDNKWDRIADSYKRFERRIIEKWTTCGGHK